MGDLARKEGDAPDGDAAAFQDEAEIAPARLPVAEVILALWVGKLLKYLVYAGLASAFPNLWIARARGRLTTLNAVLGRAGREPPQSGVP